MGNVGSRIDDSGALFLKDQNKCQFFSISHSYQTNGGKTMLTMFMHAITYSFGCESHDYKLEE
jgi:hypothetical protein